MCIRDRSADVLHRGGPGEATRDVRPRVLATRARQQARQGHLNQELGPSQLAVHVALQSADADMLEEAMRRMRLSARAYHRVLRVARTIADMEGCAAVAAAHLQEALMYRVLDRLPA